MKDVNIGYVRSARFNLVDLAGSERISKTGARGQTIEEAKNINTSLSALGLVIEALSEGNNSNKFVPFRNSKLTQLLKDSMGGNARTCMIATISPADNNFDESQSTLR